MKRHQPRHLMLHLSVHNLDTISIGDKNWQIPLCASVSLLKPVSAPRQGWNQYFVNSSSYEEVEFEILSLPVLECQRECCQFHQYCQRYLSAPAKSETLWFWPNFLQAEPTCLKALVVELRNLDDISVLVSQGKTLPSSPAVHGAPEIFRIVPI